MAAATLVVEGCIASGGSGTSASTAAASSPGRQPPSGAGCRGEGLQPITGVNLNGVSPGGVNTAEVVAAAATAFLKALNPTQMVKVVYDFSNNTARQTWSNYPAMVVPRSGMGMSDLSTAQQSGVDTMLQDTNIRQAEDYLASLGGQGASEFGALKDYYVAVYAAPSTAAPS